MRSKIIKKIRVNTIVGGVFVLVIIGGLIWAYRHSIAGADSPNPVASSAANDVPKPSATALVYGGDQPSQYYVYLAWSIPSPDDAYGFQIERQLNGKRETLAVLNPAPTGATELSDGGTYIDNDVKLGDQPTYYVTTFDRDATMSAPVQASATVVLDPNEGEQQPTSALFAATGKQCFTLAASYNNSDANDNDLQKDQLQISIDNKGVTLVNATDLVAKQPSIAFAPYFDAIKSDQSTQFVEAGSFDGGKSYQTITLLADGYNHPAVTMRPAGTRDNQPVWPPVVEFCGLANGRHNIHFVNNDREGSMTVNIADTAIMDEAGKPITSGQALTLQRPQ